MTIGCIQLMVDAADHIERLGSADLSLGRAGHHDAPETGTSEVGLARPAGDRLRPARLPLRLNEVGR